MINFEGADSSARAPLPPHCGTRRRLSREEIEQIIDEALAVVNEQRVHRAAVRSTSGTAETKSQQSDTAENKRQK